MRRREGELVELSVERIGAAGDGVARWRGEPVFLPFTVPGDHVRARLGSRRGGGLEAHVVELMGAGPGRAPAPCRHFGACGGCALQHLDADLYREVKLGRLLNALETGRDRPPGRRAAADGSAGAAAGAARSCAPS